MNAFQKTSIAAVFMAAALFVSLLPGRAEAGCGAGDKAQVLWKGTWYPATVLKGKGSQCYIHYDGYGSSWDEWVGPDRIRLTGGGSAAVSGGAFSDGDPVMVKWKGAWYPAHVIGVVGKGSYRIHYDGYDNSWDEVVGPGRIRAR